MDISKICFNCMRGEVDDDSGVCECCGKKFSDIKLSENYLPIGSFLREKYLMGRALGEGGFGITYIGYDINLDAQVAIKEFYPRNHASRERGTDGNVIPNEGGEEFFIAQRDRFLGEAKRLAKFRNTPSVVSVLDFFKENGTAYLVMNYIGGMTLRTLLDYSGGRIRTEEALKIIEPVMLALKEVHESGVVHRDISPDNIMISDVSNRVYLIDFGTARNSSEDEDRTISVFKKSGYTPPEQLRKKGKQGPWTDIYALCATLYRCITGIKPLDVTDRLFGDEIHKPSEYGISIPPGIEAAMMKGLEIRNEDRFQRISELYDAIYKSDEWQDVGDEEYIKVVEAVRHYKMYGSARPKAEEAYKKKEGAEAVAAPIRVFEDDHQEMVRIVEAYKKSAEYQNAYDRFIKEDPEHLREIEYAKVKEIVHQYKVAQLEANPGARINLYDAQMLEREKEETVALTRTLFQHNFK